MPERCYNCGIPGHLTQNCARYGPKYPAPGKTSADYVELNQQIMNKVAQDIIVEHMDHAEEEESLGSNLPRRLVNPLSERRIKVACENCGADPGQWCMTKNGGHSERLHISRREAVPS